MGMSPSKRSSDTISLLVNARQLEDLKMWVCKLVHYSNVMAIFKGYNHKTGFAATEMFRTNRISILTQNHSKKLKQGVATTEQLFLKDMYLEINPQKQRVPRQSWHPHSYGLVPWIKVLGRNFFQFFTSNFSEYFMVSWYFLVVQYRWMKLWSRDGSGRTLEGQTWKLKYLCR